MSWWEARRIPFNLIVGAVGVLASAALLLIALISEHVIGERIGWPDPPLIAVLAVALYAIGANVCFTGGWISELVVRRTWPEEADRFGGLAFALGWLSRSWSRRGWCR